jgi:hypothetical protein
MNRMGRQGRSTHSRDAVPPQAPIAHQAPLVSKPIGSTGTGLDQFLAALGVFGHLTEMHGERLQGCRPIGLGRRFGGKFTELSFTCFAKSSDVYLRERGAREVPACSTGGAIRASAPSVNAAIPAP